MPVKVTFKDKSPDFAEDEKPKYPFFYLAKNFINTTPYPHLFII